ncbi:MAG: exopolysaccharide biosynthesis protein [Xanthobacteraceae bacterium]
MQPYVPTSVALAQVLDEAPQDYVSLDWLLSRLAKRSFGLGMLLLALVGLAPGLSLFVGILLAFPAVQMILGHESPTLPGFLASRRIPTGQIARLAARFIPVFARMESLIRPRLRAPFLATKRLVGLIVLLLAATLIWPFPFSQIIPALVIMLISFAYLEEDGVLLCISLAAALFSLSITAATVWATVHASGLIERLWTGS